jgi:hypothetical protein
MQTGASHSLLFAIAGSARTYQSPCRPLLDFSFGGPIGPTREQASSTIKAQGFFLPWAIGITSDITASLAP